MLERVNHSLTFWGDWCQMSVIIISKNKVNAGKSPNMLARHVRKMRHFFQNMRTIKSRSMRKIGGDCIFT